MPIRSAPPTIRRSSSSTTRWPSRAGWISTIRRWDTPGHLAGEPGRVDPVGRPYPPMHDVQMMVDGAAAAALGELARARWQAATGRQAATDAPPPAPARRPVARRDPARHPRRAHRHRPHDAGLPRCAGGPGDGGDRAAVDRRRAPLHLYREPVPDLGRDRRRAGAPARRSRRPRDRRRAPARGTRLAGAELDGRHARAPAAPPPRQRPPRPPARSSTRRCPTSTRAPA